MTNEQREAIEYLKESVLIYKNTIPKISDAIDTVLSLIKEQEEEIEKKDKQIDYIIDFIRERSIYAVDTHEKLKQYFEIKAKQEQ